MYSRTEPVNLLTGDHVDKDTDTPAFKELAVYLEVLQGDKPVLGRNHHRFGHPTPRSGVEARRKRQRDDYVGLDKPLPEESGL
jgi:formate dehydrogenase major subunit